DPSRLLVGLLYSDAVVSSDAPPGYPPAVRVPPGASRQVLAKARYLTAVHFDDGLVGEVLDDLERRGLLQSTIIIVTSDHGMEFDENGLGFIGHGTAFSDYQLHTPMLVHWPSRPPGRVVRRTSHNDLAPTLVTELFPCRLRERAQPLFRRAVGLAHHGQLHRFRPPSARSSDDHLPHRLRGARPRVSPHSSSRLPPGRSTGRASGDASLLSVGTSGKD